MEKTQIRTTMILRVKIKDEQIVELEEIKIDFLFFHKINSLLYKNVFDLQTSPCFPGNKFNLTLGEYIIDWDELKQNHSLDGEKWLYDKIETKLKENKRLSIIEDVQNS